MKAYVITITGLRQSIDSANKCITSAKKYDLSVDMFSAITPKHNPIEMLKIYKINPSDFETKHSRKLNGISCFLSHYMLWKLSIKLHEPIIIFEHDAVIIAPIPNIEFDKLISIGKPSFGSYKVANSDGVHNLFSKPYLPGAHAYIIKPEGAKELIHQSQIKAKFADTFINIETFPWIQEYYPWPVICDDSYTTVQAELGCKAKHNFNEKFKIVDI